MKRNVGELSRKRGFFAPLILSLAVLGACEKAADDKPGLRADLPSLTQGRAEMTNALLFECDVPGWRVTAVGQIKASDGTNWVVPASTDFKTGPRPTDLYNECEGVTLENAEALDLDIVPVTEIDAAGEIITAYIFGDNYYEFYVNGSLVAVDPVPYWPFNTGVVRFRSVRPFTAAFKLVDWEENLGIGSELMRGVPFHPGDGGLSVVFKNEVGETIAITDGLWRAQTYYISPFNDPDCLVLASAERDSSGCDHRTAADGEDLYGVHWILPDNWATPGFDDSGWPLAHTYTRQAIGSSIQRPAYENFADIFDNPEADAEFIWSGNLVLDNLVLVRRTIK